MLPDAPEDAMPREDDNGWRTIESAPKDGTKVDLWFVWWRAELDGFTGRRMTDAWWHPIGKHWENGDARPDNVKFTHWRLLPEPPHDP